MAKKMHPLYVYRKGQRVKIGNAHVRTNNMVTLRVTDKSINLLMKIFDGDFFWAPSKQNEEQICGGCVLGLCGDEPKEGNCSCCKHDHIL